MPTYEYACQSCGTHVEVVQRFDDEPLTECGVCEGPLRRVFHPAGILFKGSGFYATDSRSARGDRARDKPKDDSARTGSAEKSASGSASGAEGSGSGTKKQAASAPSPGERSA